MTPTHKTHPTEYRAWTEMKRRCSLPSCKAYPRYGGRGISVCNRWIRDFPTFFADMGSKPSSRHSLDRYPDNDGNYEPNNCRWADWHEQQRNRSSNHRIEVNGISLTMAEWAEKIGMSRQAFFQRLNRGWSPQEIIETPLGPPICGKGKDKRNYAAPQEV